MSVGIGNIVGWVMYLRWKINIFCFVKSERIELFNETKREDLRRK
jgi:hypothetical protein